ncbi:hypothetical protein PoB_006470200 [Plakobranchus ocellatus]|uniref:Uncharacterized protein n=1 Tax=Plakobranchus ocellatus TaxID=259542 RepID=A0AAV4D1X8_9GAST|nr:hypothetical protein PoB_006470200 [Plakobranchus ocellatus]
MISSVVPFRCRHAQRSSCPLSQGLRSGRRRTHHHRHVRILRASRTFHVPNDDILGGVWDAQHFYFTTQVRCPQAATLWCRSISASSFHHSADFLRQVPCAPQHLHIRCPASRDSWTTISPLRITTWRSLVPFGSPSAAQFVTTVTALFRSPAEAFHPLFHSGGYPSPLKQDLRELHYLLSHPIVAP